MSATLKYPSILVIGHGELGFSIISSLHNHVPKPRLTQITVLARPQTISTLCKADPDKYSLFYKWGITLLPFDLESSTSDALQQILKQFTIVIHASGMFASPGTPTKLVTAARDAGVKYFIPWQFGVDYDAIGPVAGDGLFAEQYRIREFLRTDNRGMKWNIISNGLFTSFLFYEAFGIVDKERTTVTALGGWENKVTLTAAEDIGRLTAEIVYDRAEGRLVEDGVLYIAGETLTYGEIADVLDEKLGKTLKRGVLDGDSLKKVLEKDPENKIARYQAVFGAGVGCSWAKEKTYNAEKETKTLTLSEWMDTHKV